MNTELWKNIGAIADDDALMRRLTRYTRRLVKEKEIDPTLMTKEEFFKMIDQRMEEYENGDNISFSSPEEMHRYFENF